MTYRIAACNWKLCPTIDWSAFEAHLTSVLDQCAEADVVVLPENLILELAGERPSLPPSGLVETLCRFTEPYEQVLLRESAARRQLIVGGSHFRQGATGFLNVTAVAEPNGALTYHPKHKLTQYEIQNWGLTAGSTIGPSPNPDLGVLICYDSEFPEAGRILAECGISILAVPAYTETRRGFQRVRWSCQARALENQVFVVHASLVGTLGGEPVPEAVGSSAVIAPSVEPFPESAILAETGWNEEAVAIALLDLYTLHRARETGDVRNWQDRTNDWKLG